MRYKPVLLVALSAAFATACETSIPPQFAAVSTAGITPFTPFSEGILVLSPHFARLPIGGALQLQTNAASLFDIEWTSLNPNVATVSQTGLVVGTSIGIATIRGRLFADTNNLAISKIEVAGVFVP